MAIKTWLPDIPPEELKDLPERPEVVVPPAPKQNGGAGTPSKKGEGKTTVTYKDVLAGKDTDKAEGYPPITIPATSDELDQVDNQQPVCIGCRNTIEVYKVALHGGKVIYVEALDDSSAEQKARDAGYNVAWVTWSPPSSTTNAPEAPAAEPSISTEPSTEQVEPTPLQPVHITKYTFTLDNGKVQHFEAMTEAEAKAYVLKWRADPQSLKVSGTRELSQQQIAEILRGAASHSDMDYARALVKYGQVKGVVPVRDGKTGDPLLISEADWAALSEKYQDIVTNKGFDALNDAIYKDLPNKYQSIADKRGIAAAIDAYNADIERIDKIVDKLEPYREGDSYDIVKPLELGVVTSAELKLAGFDSKAVTGVQDYVNKLSSQLDKWDKYAAALKAAIDKHGDKDPEVAAMAIHKATAGILTNAEQHDFFNAITESGTIKKYGLGGVAAELQSLPELRPLADKWKAGDISLADKYNIAEIYASYPAPNKLLPSGYRGLIAEAPQMNAVARFTKQFAAGGAAAVLTPFVKEQIKDNLNTVLADYKEDGAYNITKYLKDSPEDGGLLARGGIEVKDIERALDGKKVLATPKGATAKDWAVAGLIVTAVGAGGASFVVAQPAKSGLVAASGLSTLGLGAFATVDTVKYWPQMDSAQRAIAIAFDVLLLTSGALATKGGVSGFNRYGGWTKVRNKAMYNYRAARNFIKKLLPNSKKADTILYNLKRAIETNDTKLLKAAARQLELEAGKMPKQLGEALQTKARLLQAAPDDIMKLNKAAQTAPKDLNKAIETMTNEIAAMEKALRRVKDPKRYNTITQALEKVMLDRERLLKTQTATKTKTAIPFQEPVEVGKYLPAKAGSQTKAITKAPPAKMPDVIEVGTKKVPIKEIRKKSPSEVAQKHFVSIWDISRATRKLPKGVQEEIALYSPEWAILIKTKGATITATKTALRTNLRNAKQQQAQTKPKPALYPMPHPSAKPQPEPAVKTQAKQKKKLAEKEALAIYPFFQIPQEVKTRYKRKRKRLDFDGGGEVDISDRLPKERKGIISWRQGMFYITAFPPYKDDDFIYTKKKPFYAETSKGRRSPQRTVKAVGGKVPQLVMKPMGVVTAKVQKGDILTFAPRSKTKRRHKGRRRGRLVYA